MEALWRLESCCCIAWTATGRHEGLPFLVCMGQSSENFPVQEPGLAFPTITGTGQKNIQDLPLVESSNILLPFLLMTLGLVKNFGRAVY